VPSTWTTPRPPVDIPDCNTAVARAQAETAENILSANMHASADGVTSIFAAGFFSLDF
jgi:hypothetical protein